MANGDQRLVHLRRFYSILRRLETLWSIFSRSEMTFAFSRAGEDVGADSALDHPNRGRCAR